jgi:hypothetical protein
MILSDVMDDVARRLEAINGLRAYGFPPDKVSVPAAVVTYPDSYTYDGTYRRGADRMALQLVAVVGRASDRASRDLLSVYVDGDGPESFKRVLESGDLPAYTSFHSLRVTGVEFDVVTIAGVEYVAALFTLDILGSGALWPSHTRKTRTSRWAATTSPLSATPRAWNSRRPATTSPRTARTPR